MASTDIFDKPKQVLTEIAGNNPGTTEELEQFRIRYIGSKGIIKQLFAAIKDVPNEHKRAYGQQVNEVKQAAEEKFNRVKAHIESLNETVASDQDLTRPANFRNLGSRHPISLIRGQIIEIFKKIGFSIADGPEIEDDWHNFSALNIPPDHPARDMQDTFFVEQNPDIVLRTHTSPVQIRYLENHKPPVRIISPGRVYRVDNDSTHSPVFHQVEGLYIAEGVSFAELKQTLYHFVAEMFGPDKGIRFRPSFFPFTEPSAEMDIEWDKNGESTWMEILGCGMVDPAVLENCQIDPEKYTGFAFGMGVERIAMLKYGISDIRLFYENDIRFLNQFKGE